MKEITIHIGAHKSASTTIQKNFIANEENISNNLGLKYIIGNYRKYPYFLFLEIASNLIDYTDEKIFEDHIKKAKVEFNKIVSENINHDKLLISWEGFLGHSGMHKYGSLYPHTPFIFKALKKITEDYKVKIILIIRKQSDFIESCYLQQIKEGQIITFNDYMESIDLNKTSWLRIANELTLAFGIENVIIRPFEEIKKGTHEFLDTLLTFATSEVNDQMNFKIIKSANLSMSNYGVETALKLYPHAKNNIEKRNMREFLHKYFSSKNFGKASFLSTAEKERIDIINRAENQTLFKKYISDLTANYYD